MKHEFLTQAPVNTSYPESSRSSLEPLIPTIESHLHVFAQPLAKIEPSPLTVDHSASPIVQPTSAIQPRASTPHFRNGKIARLPKLERDMVNRMLYNHVPYAKIVDALAEREITVTERNVSNWKTRGGYKEWCAEQERQINLSRLQDNLIDHLRKNDASQIPEVGLQVAATQLSLVLLQPDLTQQLAANPKNYSCVVDMLCQLATQIQSLQKDRDQAVKQAAIRGTPEQLKRRNELLVESARQTFTEKRGQRPSDPDIPHRNELPKRDELPFRQPAPPPPSPLEILKMINSMSSKRSLSGSSVPQPKVPEGPSAGEMPCGHNE